MNDRDWQTASTLLRVSAQLVEGISEGMVERGFVDVRPVHGFVFAALSPRPATASELAAELQVTKQAAAQLISYLVDRGYLTREPDPRDRRAQLIALTERGRACTVAAQESAEAYVGGWRDQLSRTEFDALVRSLSRIALPGRLRLSW